MLQRLAPHRLHHIACEDIVLDVMGGQYSRLDADLAARRWVSAARRILLRMSSFLPNSALRVMGPHERSGGNSEFFDQEGTPVPDRCARIHPDGDGTGRTTA